MDASTKPLGSGPDTDFHRRFDVSYLDPTLPRATRSQAFRHFTASALIYGGAFLLISISPWYRDLLQGPFCGHSALFWYGCAYVAYLLIAPVVFLVARPRSLWVSKNLFWLTTVIPDLIPNTALVGFTWPRYLLYLVTCLLGLVGWCTVYFLRAVTEERFLMRDPDYVAYCSKVRYRFIPGVY